MIRQWHRLALVLATAAALVPAALAAGSASSGRGFAWGDNADGQLGNGTITRYGGIPTPGPVTGLAGATAVAGGSDFSLALKSDGVVWAWGNGGWGQLGQGVYGSSSVPLRVAGLTGVTAIAAGDLHALALKSDGTVWAWGFDYYGQVGNTSGGNVLAPVRVRGLGHVVAVAAGNGSFTSYALKADGTVWAWGYDGLGQLGNGSSDESPHPTPTRVTGLSGVVSIAAGQSHALAVRGDGTVRAWGADENRQLGAATSASCGAYATACSTTPLRVRGLTGVSAVAGGANFSLALDSGGAVWGWGDNGYGELATGSASGTVVRPTRTSLHSIVAIAAGAAHTLALRSDGTVWAAGSNEWGQLGDGSFGESARPVRAVGIAGATAIGSGLDHSLAVQP